MFIENVEVFIEMLFVCLWMLFVLIIFVLVFFFGGVIILLVLSVLFWLSKFVLVVVNFLVMVFVGKICGKICWIFYEYGLILLSWLNLVNIVWLYVLVVLLIGKMLDVLLIFRIFLFDNF